MIKSQHKYFFLAIFIAYIVTISISTYFNVKENTCKNNSNIFVDSKPDDNVVVLTWESQNHWTGWGRSGEIYWAGYEDPAMLKCRETCLFTGDQGIYKSADVIIFEPQPFGKRGSKYPQEKICGQKYMMFTYETDVYFPIQRNKNYLSHMDWKMSYQADSTVQVSFVCSWGSNKGIDAYKEKPLPFKEKTGLVAFVASNCKSGGADKRANYVSELMKHIKVDSYGLCLQNQDKNALNRNTAKDRFSAKMDLFKKYKFVLAFENNNITDYVTEKLPHTYLSGSLPVYMGANNVDDWAPGDNSLINANKFKSPKQLAEYLKKLANNETLYNSYFAWKDKPMRERFHQHYNNCVFLAECRVCDRVRQERINAKHSDYQPSSLSLATSGSANLPDILNDYVFDDEFFLVNDIAIIVIICVSLLYTILFIFGVYEKLKNVFCRSNYFKLQKTSSKSTTLATSPIGTLTTTDYLSVDNQIDIDQNSNNNNNNNNNVNI